MMWGNKRSKIYTAFETEMEGRMLVALLGFSGWFFGGL